MFNLTDQVALVTGGSNGIGKGIVESLSQAGAKVLIADIDEENGEKTAKEFNGHFYKLDVSKKDEVDKVVTAIYDEHKKIDILVSNTGIYPNDLIEDMSEDDWDRVFDINVKGNFLITKPILKKMKEQGYGRVILTSSITGDITGYPGGSHYGASKAAQLGFIRSASLEYAKFGITINAVQPGVIGTESLKRELGVLYDKAAESIPTKTLGEPEDIGYTVLFFASKEAKYITGQSLVVDGGLVLPETPDVIL